MPTSNAYGIYFVQHSSQSNFCFRISNLLKCRGLFIPTADFSFPQTQNGNNALV